MNTLAKILVDSAAARFGRESFTVIENDTGPDAQPGSVELTFPHPRRSGHVLRIIQRGRSLEVTYEDGEPPGPAERLFVSENSGESVGVVDGALEFAVQVFSGRVVVCRERLGAITRLLRRDGCETLLWFLNREDLSAEKRARMAVCWDWTK